MNRKLKLIITISSLFAITAVPSFVVVKDIIKSHAEEVTYLTNGSSTSYKINYFSGQSTVDIAAKDIQTFIKESTGASLPLQTLSNSYKVSGLEYITIAKTNYVPTGLSKNIFHKLASYKIKC